MFRYRLYLRCDEPTCPAELPLVGKNILLEAPSVAEVAGWYYDQRTTTHLCPTHRPSSTDKGSIR